VAKFIRVTDVDGVEGWVNADQVLGVQRTTDDPTKACLVYVPTADGKQWETIVSYEEAERFVNEANGALSGHQVEELLKAGKMKLPSRVEPEHWPDAIGRWCVCGMPWPCDGIDSKLGRHYAAQRGETWQEKATRTGESLEGEKAAPVRDDPRPHEPS
jgi:hypothetical protein